MLLLLLNALLAKEEELWLSMPRAVYLHACVFTLGREKDCCCRSAVVTGKADVTDADACVLVLENR